MFAISIISNKNGKIHVLSGTVSEFINLVYFGQFLFSFLFMLLSLLTKSILISKYVLQCRLV